MLLLLVSSAHAARFLLLGDAGEKTVEVARARVDGVIAPCAEGETGTDCELAAMMVHARARAEREPMDAVIALGDNFYGNFWKVEPAPVCDAPGPGVSPRRVARLVGVVERYDALYGLFSGIPILGVLGNHDVGHGWWFAWKARRACSEAAMHAAGWNGADTDGGIGERRFGDGLVRLLDTNRKAEENVRALQPVESTWELWAGHHAWSLSHEKGAQPKHLRERLAEWVHADAKPTIWVNGHAHHQEAVLKDGVLAITSGSGSKDRELKRKQVDAPDTVFYADPCRGYSVLEVDGEPLTARVRAYAYDDTPVGEVTCTWSGKWECQGSDPRPGKPPEKCGG